jgi:hypothetical protein
MMKRTLDLNLLVVPDALLDERNVTRAAVAPGPRASWQRAPRLPGCAPILATGY